MKNADQPAFPGIDTQDTSYVPGLTKRELAAFMAMQGLCAGISGEVAGHDGGENLAALAVSIADKTISEVEKQHP